MFTYAKPSEVGISSKQIQKYIKNLEKYGMSTHALIIARHDKICFEQYWEPFDANFNHRIYSDTKSFVSIAVGFLIQDGKLSLDDKIVDFFPNDVPKDVLPNIKKQTIRDMLMMTTGVVMKNTNWFRAKPSDRVKFYFENTLQGDPAENESRTPGLFFAYDSVGSFVLGALVERLAGKSLIDYLREKLFDKIGVSRDIKMLKCPGGHSWGDSGLLCKPTDMLKTAKFVMNYGKVNGEQILSEEYLKEATSNLISTPKAGWIENATHGYGYQFWRTWNNSFFFNGMGCQFAICVPDKDIVMVYNGDNQGSAIAKTIIIDRFFEEIVETADDKEFADGNEAYENLRDYCKTLKLRFCDGEISTKTAEKINGKTFNLSKNPMGITKIKLTFGDDEGKLEYTNAQGDKVLDFGLCKNVFTQFPEEGYSDEFGTVYAPNHYYKCASSAAWLEEKKLAIMVQVIDEYFGRLYITLSFNDEGRVGMLCAAAAEDFFNTYRGYAEGDLV